MCPVRFHPGKRLTILCMVLHSGIAGKKLGQGRVYGRRYLLCHTLLHVLDVLLTTFEPVGDEFVLLVLLLLKVFKPPCDEKMRLLNIRTDLLGRVACICDDGVRASASALFESRGSAPDCLDVFGDVLGVTLRLEYSTDEAHYSGYKQARPRKVSLMNVLVDFLDKYETIQFMQVMSET